jgi:alanyl-tRNA synthetase
MKASELRRLYINFFAKKHGHAEIPGGSLIPENDPTVLFTTAGMHPLVPYLMGESHPAGKRLVDVQKCLRTDDIDEVGDATHCTFFEMLGNWSLGDYFKEGAIKMSWEFLTATREDGGLGLDPERLCVSCFAGDDDAPRDEDSAQIWRDLGLADQRIFFYEKKENWWGPAGLTGPCGPDTEMFYYTGDYDPADPASVAAMWDTEPADDDTPWVEIWNDVFMQYFKEEDGSYSPLDQKNVDTGMGFERVLAILNGVETHYETELFADAIVRIRELAVGADAGDEAGLAADKMSERVIADHVRSATFILGDENGVTPSNNDQGYVLRKLIRRAIRHGRKLGIEGDFVTQLARIYLGIYGDDYPELIKNEQRIMDALRKEEEQFGKTLAAGEAEIAKDVERVAEGLEILQRENTVARIEMALNAVSQNVADKEALKLFNQKLRPVLGKLRGEFKAEAAGKEVPVEVLEDVRVKAAELADAVEAAGAAWKLRGDRAFYYFESFGFPLEMTVEMMAERGIEVEEEGFEKAFKAHQEKSRAGSEKKFAGGLADHGEETKRLHTASHLMLEALRRVLGDHVEQRGSNITAERLRFDFNHDEKVNAEQLAEVERIVNEQIEADLPIKCEEMTVEEAKGLNATGIFADKYAKELGGKVKVYVMGDFSSEICGGPHAERTGELVEGGEGDDTATRKFKIKKEQSSSAGVRRIKAMLV